MSSSVRALRPVTTHKQLQQHRCEDQGQEYKEDGYLLRFQQGWCAGAIPSSSVFARRCRAGHKILMGQSKSVSSSVKAQGPVTTHKQLQQHRCEDQGRESQ